MYKNELRLQDELADRLKKAVEVKKQTWSKYSINDFIVEAIKEKLEKGE